MAFVGVPAIGPPPPAEVVTALVVVGFDPPAEVVRVVVVTGAVAPAWWHVHSAETRLGLLEQLDAHAGSAEVAVTTDWVKVAQKVAAAALLLM